MKNSVILFDSMSTKVSLSIQSGMLVGTPPESRVYNPNTRITLTSYDFNSQPQDVNIWFGYEIIQDNGSIIFKLKEDGIRPMILSEPALIGGYDEEVSSLKLERDVVSGFESFLSTADFANDITIDDMSFFNSFIGVEGETVELDDYFSYGISSVIQSLRVSGIEENITFSIVASGIESVYEDIVFAEFL